MIAQVIDSWPHCRNQIAMHTFNLTPQAVPANFKWRSDRYHLTYSGYIPLADLLNMVANVTSTPLIGYSICHENTDRMENGTTIEGYKHTHWAMIFKARLMLQGARKFDITYTNGVDGELAHAHPNIQPKVTMAAMEQLFTQYHAGRKFDITTGSMKYKIPLLHEMKLPEEWEWNREVMNEICAASSLFEACIAGQVRPRSVMDLRALRDDTADRAAKMFHHLYDPASFRDICPKFAAQEPGFGALHVWGPSGVGKTKWACAQFKNPCFIKPFDSIGCLESLAKQFDPELHDGLVLDEADLTFMSRQQVIAFLDMDEPCTLNVRYKAFTLPAGVRKLIISNPSPEKLYPADPHGAIARRFKTLKINEQTWQGTPLSPIVNGATPLTLPAI